MSVRGDAYASPAKSERTYDAVIVGGGVIGLATAWRAARRGLGVCVLERGRPGSGASRASAGILAPDVEAGIAGKALLALGIASARRWPSFADELAGVTGERVGYERPGAVYPVLGPDGPTSLGLLAAQYRESGLEAEIVSGEECRRLEPGLAEGCSAGLHVPSEAHVDPRRLTALLAQAVTRSGGEIHEHTPAARLVVDDGRVLGVVAGGGRRFIGPVVLAAGAWSASIGGPAGDVPVRPVKGQILRLEATGDAASPRKIVRGPGIYVVGRATGEIVVGATVEEAGFDVTVTASAVRRLLDEASRLVPAVAGLRLVEGSAGSRPGSPDGGPLVGASSCEGLLLATGHFRNGILLAPLTADAIVALIAGERAPSEIEPFAPSRLRSA